MCLTTYRRRLRVAALMRGIVQRNGGSEREGGMILQTIEIQKGFGEGGLEPSRGESRAVARRPPAPPNEAELAER